MDETAQHPGTVGDRIGRPGGRLVTLDGRTLPLRSITLRGAASGGQARVTLEQRFQNPYPDPLRVTYQLPMPADAAVSAYAFRVGERRVVGEVDRLEAARERFEQAIVDGHTGALLEQDRSSLFTQEIGNIPPGLEIVAELTIDQPLRWLEDGAWEWRFPTAVTPSFLGEPGRTPDAGRVDVNVTGDPMPIAASLGLVIGDVLAVGRRPESPSHAIVLSPAAEGLGVALVDEHGRALDRDLVVRWAVAQPHVAVGLDSGRPAPGRPHASEAFGLVTITPPRSDQTGPVLPRDLIVLLDTSGSMAGEPIDQARQVVTSLIHTLCDGDRLELIAFAEAPHRWKARPAAATASARRDALQWLGGLRAGGSTEMRAGIVEALWPLRGGAQRQVVLITDGAIGFEEEIVGEIARALPEGCRLHTVGVGSAVNRTLTAGAARAGRGAEIVLGPREDPAPAVTRLLTRLERPLLTEVTLSGSALVDHAPARLPDVHATAPVLVSLRLRPEGGDLRVSGRRAGRPWEETLRVGPVDAVNAALPVRYAREAVEDLEMRRAAGETSVDQEIERLGLEFQIATRRTAWVAISEEPSVDPRRPMRHERVPLALPEGLSAEGLGLGREPGFALYSLAASSFQSLAAPAGPRRLAERKLGAPTRGTRRLVVVGRVVLRRDRELVIEITLDRPLDWAPTRARVIWDRGPERRAAIEHEATTQPGPYGPGQVMRLVLRLGQRLLRVVPTAAPSRVTVDCGPTTLDILLEP